MLNTAQRLLELLLLLLFGRRTFPCLWWDKGAVKMTTQPAPKTSNTCFDPLVDVYHCPLGYHSYNTG